MTFPYQFPFLLGALVSADDRTLIVLPYSRSVTIPRYGRAVGVLKAPRTVAISQ